MVRKSFFYKIIFLCVLLCVIICSPVFAGGDRDKNRSRTAEDPAGFTDSFGIDDYKPGKYNYYLEAKDNAGNAMRSGPENIFIDPVSDLPQATIINPLPMMRVQGNLNLVGIAFDDDAVHSVEFTIQRGRDGKGEELVHVMANGADYWSYFLNTTDTSIWTDGIYTVTAWATDVNGLSGISPNFNAKQQKKHQVYWVLDRKKPEISVTSHEIGALVAGTVRMRGIVTDGNGIRNLKYSTDGGNRYTTIRPSQNRRTGEYDWDININSKTLEDGPAVIWFQSQDECGSLGTAAHLLFVNNTGPTVGIVYPESGATVNGIFTIAGYADHPVGLKSVTWNAGKNIGGEFELLPGNQWFSADVDIRSEKISSVDIEVRAEDVSGNVTVSKAKYRVDQNADMPVVTLSAPSPGVLETDFGLVVKGSVSDDDGVKSVHYSVNGGAAVEIPCSGYFQFVIHDLAEGTVNLDVWAEDITGVAGPKVPVKGILVPGTLPGARIASVTAGTGQRAAPAAFFTGMTVALEPKARVMMDISVIGNPASATISFAGGAPIVIRPAGGKAAVQIPENLPSGLAKIEIKMQDRFSRETVIVDYMYVSAPEPFYGQGGFTIAKAEVLPDGRYLLKSPEETLLGIDGNGRQFYSAQIRGTGADGLWADVDEHGRVTISALREGDYGPLSVYLQTYEGSYESQQFRLLVDYAAPAIHLQNVPTGWLQNSVPVGIAVTGANRVTSVEYSLDMGENWISFVSPQELIPSRPFSQNFSRTMEVGSMEDGAVCILIKATDEAGRTAYANFSVFKDTAAPEARLIMPITEARVNGTIRMGFEIKDFGKIRSVSYSRPAGLEGPAINANVYDSDLWEKEYPPMFLEVLMDSLQMPLSENMRFTFEDMAGNRSEVNTWDFIIDQEMDIPVAHVILPLEDEVITEDFIVSGVMFDDDDIAQVYYKIDEGREDVIYAENGFSIPIALSSLTDNEHTVTVTAEDIYGVKSEPVTRKFKVSLTEPTAEVIYPLYDTVLMDSVEIRGSTFDRNGISELNVSLDNGNTYSKVYGEGWRTEEMTGEPQYTVEWNYRFNTKILKDGPHVVFIKVLDGYGIPATYASMINVDNTPPDVVLDSPEDSGITVGLLSVMGRVLDPNLETVGIEFRSLEGKPVAEELRNRPQAAVTIIKDTLNITNQQDGLYNITVVAKDKAGNVTRTSRNVEMARQTFKNFINVLYPLDNETVCGSFFLYGYAGGTEPAGTVTIRINNMDRMTVDVDGSGYYRIPLDKESLYEGKNVITVHSSFGGGETVFSRVHNLTYKMDGPWVAIDSFNFGNFAYERPYLFGRSGYILSEQDVAALADRNTDRELRAEINSKVLDYTEISFDNGRTYVKTSKALARDVTYRYRLETGDMTEGNHYILVRSVMKNGETAVTRMIVQVDKTFPEIRLITPEAGGRYNQEIAYSATATDDVDLKSLTYHLRAGDKSAYEIPGFLQGLYLEGIIPPFIGLLAPAEYNDPERRNLQTGGAPVVLFGGGATFFDVGLGLSFFDDNVKLQLQYGMMTQDMYESLGGTQPLRYGGNVLGLKLLASVYQLPFGPLWGPDWEWLSASFALGANFSLFDIAREGYTQSGEPTWMSALLLQIEFPRVTIPKRSYLRTFSLFTEGQLWFVPTDVNAEANQVPVVIPHFIMGVRMYVF